MTTSGGAVPCQRWHSNDFLTRIARAEAVDDDASGSEPTTTADEGCDIGSTVVPELSFDAPSLLSVSADPDLHERLTLRRSRTLSTPHLINFAARNLSVWALDVLVGRLTGDRQDWDGLRAALLQFDRRPSGYEPTLDQIELADLYALAGLLHERAFDPPAERGALRYVADRMIGGGELPGSTGEAVVVSLLIAGLVEQAAALLPRLDEETWLWHAIAAELEHPRFGGSFDAMLGRLNAAYQRFGLERITLGGSEDTPFDRLDAVPLSRLRTGPLVTMIISCDRPGTELRTAVRSVVGQTYQNWELIVIDDGSPQQHGPILDEVAALDPRIRVIRNEVRAGGSVRRNEAIRLARGEFVAIQHSCDWSHPRRIEMQVRDLLGTPARWANVVHGATAGDDFSLFTAHGAGPTPAESSLLFRREPVIEAVGWFDDAHPGSDDEFRRRLETATRSPLRAVAAEIPLQFLRARSDQEPSGSVDNRIWIDPELMAYRSSAHRFHERIRTGRSDPRLGFDQDRRSIVAPPRLLGIEPAAHQVDLLVVVDGHYPSWRRAFVDAVADELRTAISAGLRVALLHSESVSGVQNIGPLAKRLQAMIDSGQLLQVFEADRVEASVVVVRHAGAAQGHHARRRPVTSSRVVIVEDRLGGDVRGETIARGDVLDIVTAWFGIEPSWTVARPIPPRPTVTSVVVEADTVTVRLEGSDLPKISAVRIGNGNASLELEAWLGEDDGGDYLTGTGSLAPLPDGEIWLTVERRTGDESSTLQACPVSARSVLTGPGERLLVSGENGGLRMLPAADPDGLGGAEFYRRHLAAEVSQARAFRDLFEVTVSGAGVAGLTALFALRNVNGRIRRREFIIDHATEQEVRARHSLTKIENVRWRIYGNFQTPQGPVEVPIDVTDRTVALGGDRHRVRKLTDTGVLHVVPQPIDAPPAPAPELSVIMPVYNVGPYLDTAIRSVLTQEFEDLELIIIDDASSDNSRQIIAMHRELDPRIRVIELDHNTLGGAGIPSNIGIRAARGNYIAFVDSDDWVSRTGINRLLTLARQHDAELVIGDFRLFDDGDRQVTAPLDNAAWLDIPDEEVINAANHPSLLRLSPVPWRKLYRRDFVTAHQVRFPEGDFFYEDNALHWLVLSRAQRVVASSEVIAYHRMGREGQTMAADTYKLAAIASHANTIGNSLIESSTLADNTDLAAGPDDREALFDAFIEYLRRQNWTVRRQTQPAAAALLQRRFATVYQKAITAAPSAPVRPEVRRHFEAFGEAYPDIDLTIVIPVFNCADYLGETLDSVLQLHGVSYNVLLVDDGSTDASLGIMRDYEDTHQHVHVFSQKNRGAGRARNSVIPLITGRYSYFVDADDVVDAGALARAVRLADVDDVDLLFAKYRLDYVDEDRSRGMFDADVQIWRQLPEATGNTARRRLLAGLINYPWNRLIRTSLLHDANIFFGPTVVHNDMLFHWHSILSAKNLGFIDAEVCAHRKFSTRAQVTNIVDERRMAVVEALRGTHQRISGLANYPDIREEWQRFALDLLDWAKDRIPADLQDSYEKRGSEFVETLFETVDEAPPDAEVPALSAPADDGKPSKSSILI
ncbi:glycosyltransferase [Microlunatus soli]|uniref:Glycosyltransferase involved in cell wall bisynthesis n=1 Tax=Microlunatus soli TaxID=630515 RepID=A0A1H2AP64_9ACTN|nr:glycosyltransferase [Microlunatus soli]SDT47346.1 Glycosyltransferase involved in cell wall bisynthesis [Microlunatus soli]